MTEMDLYRTAKQPDYQAQANGPLLVAVVNAALVVGYCWLVVNWS